MKRLLLAIVLAVGCNAQPQSVTLNAPIPSALSNLNLTVVGGLGQSTYYYYIVANYPIGHVVSRGFRVTNAPTTISVSNYIQLNWSALAGASTYDVLRTTTANVFTAGSSGVCTACIVAQGLTTTTYNDQSPTLSTGYTLNAPVGSSVQFYLNNRDYSTPHLLVFNTVSGPTATLDIPSPTAFASLDVNGLVQINSVKADDYAYSLHFNKRGTTGDSTSAIKSGAELGYISFNGWNGIAYTRGALFIDYATENWTTLANGTKLSVYTTPNGTTANDTLSAVFHDLGMTATGFVQTSELTVATLMTCNAGNAGARSSVNDSNAASFTAGIGTIVAAGGTTHVPVYCDGTNWRIG